MSDRLTVQCPACHQPMVERQNSRDGSRFLGCSGYPTCMETAKLPAFLEVKRAGGLELPGFESDPDAVWDRDHPDGAISDDESEAMAQYAADRGPGRRGSDGEESASATHQRGATPDVGVGAES